jgi:integrase
VEWDTPGTERTIETFGEPRIQTVAQVEALLQAMPVKLRAAVVLAAWGTLRRGEVLGLRTHDVDLKAGIVRVERSPGERRNGAVIIGPPKSGAGRADGPWLETNDSHWSEGY